MSWFAAQVGVAVMRRGLIGTVTTGAGRRSLARLASMVMRVLIRAARGRLAAQIGCVSRVILAMLAVVGMIVISTRTLARLAMLTRLVVTLIRRRAMLSRLVMRPARPISRPVGYRNSNSRGTSAAALCAVLGRDREAWRRVVRVACWERSGCPGRDELGGDCGGDGRGDGGVACRADVDVGGFVGGCDLVGGWGGAGERGGAGDAGRNG
jgi:hypothetical protein